MKQKLRLSKLRRGIFKPSSPVVIVVLLYSLSSESIATNRGYYTDRSSPVSKSRQCRGQRKFPPQVLIWCVMSSCCISKPFLHESVTLNNVVYEDIITLKLNLFPYLNEYSSNTDEYA